MAARRRAGRQGAGGDEHVDVVVVGSGFGGSVAADRLAEAGHAVVLLERGRPYPPGSFARTPAAMGRAFWDPSEGLHGLFDVWTFRGLEGVVSSGLGGGSLIYANVLLRKDEGWFVQESPVPGGGYETWPVQRSDLDPHYDRVEHMLGATRYPYADTTAKTSALRDSAARLGLDWQLPPLAVTFNGRPQDPPVPGAPVEPAPYGNLHGRPRSTCRLCGECDIGCNDGAKNTLDHTYLSAAAHHGADLRTGCEVRGFAPLPGGGYEVHYVVHDTADEGRRTRTSHKPLHRLTCERLVLGAGTFGSTYLLLRNRAALPGISRALGTRFSGNGDLLAFLLDARDPSAAGGRRVVEGSRGPVITSAIRVGDVADGDGSTGRGYYIEDAGFPVFADWLVETSQLPGQLRRGLRFARARLRRRVGGSPKTGLSADLSALLGPGHLSAGSLPLLGMGRDVPDGVMRLHKGHLEVDWTTASSEAYFRRVRRTMHDLADDLGAGFQDNPLWWTRRVVTVHPLGGAPMGRHVAEGVCDENGEVYGFPGLHVLDGSLLPGPVGANPSLTIAAVADRACDRMAAPSARSARRPAPDLVTLPEQGRSAGPNGSRRAPGATSLSFTEEMKGFVALGVDDPAGGERLGRQLGQRLMFHLTITADDVDGFVADETHLASATGYVECDLFGGRLPVQRGWFNLFTRGPDPARRRMLYGLHLADAGGNPLTLVGHKDVHDDPGLDVWRDTSTLYLLVHSGHTAPGSDTDGPVVAAGIITIHVPDFLRQLTTFRTDGPQPAHAMESFGRLFLGELWDVYGAALAGSRT
ncbi:MAG: GMC oxidoreductase [Sporichthyaceae bacterium]